MSLVKAIKWNSFGQLTLFGLRLVSTIFLARVYGPKVFGDYAVVYAIVSLSLVLVDSGFKNALIQKPEVSPVDYSTIFLFNLIVSCSLAVILFFAAARIASLYAVAHLDTYLRLASLAFIVRSFGLIQAAHFSRRMDFKPLMVSQVCGMAGMVIVSVGMGIFHFGVYGLVCGYLAGAIIEILLLYSGNTEKTGFAFSRRSFYSLGTFGFSSLGTSLLSELASRLDIFILGHQISSNTLGLYNKARDYAQMPAGLVTKVINVSYFPKLCQLQNDKPGFVTLYYESFAIIITIAVSAFGFLYISAGFLVPFLLGPNWAGAVPYFKLFLFYSSLYIITTFSLNALNSLGKSQLYFKIALFLYTLKIGVMLVLLFSDSRNPFAYLKINLAIMLLDTILTYYFLRRNFLSSGLNPIRPLEGRAMKAMVRSILPFLCFSLLLSLNVPLVFAALAFSFFFIALISFLLPTLKKINLASRRL